MRSGFYKLSSHGQFSSALASHIASHFKRLGEHMFLESMER